jgi:hypothetical protein
MVVTLGIVCGNVREAETTTTNHSLLFQEKGRKSKVYSENKQSTSLKCKKLHGNSYNKAQTERAGENGGFS